MIKLIKKLKIDQKDNIVSITQFGQFNKKLTLNDNLLCNQTLSTPLASWVKSISDILFLPRELPNISLGYFINFELIRLLYKKVIRVICLLINKFICNIMNIFIMILVSLIFILSISFINEIQEINKEYRKSNKDHCTYNYQTNKVELSIK